MRITQAEADVDALVVHGLAGNDTFDVDAGAPAQIVLSVNQD